MSSDEPQQALINPLEQIPTKLKSVEGIQRLKRLIEKETKCVTVPSCSNLPHLLSLFQYIQKSESIPAAVLKNFPYKGGKTKKLAVDVVNSQGDNWIKVSARNPKSLDLLAMGGGNYGARSILDHAEDYLKCAQENLNLFKPPKVTFYFASGISESLAKKLENLGIQVEGTRIGDGEVKTHERIRNYQDIQPVCDSVENECSENTLSKNNQAIEQENLKLNFNNPDLTNVKKINLDITAFLCYVSNLTNGHTDTHFKKPILEEQRQFEIARPQKHILEKAMEGKELYCCETAYNEFISILDVVGGETEKQRAQELLKNVTIVPDQRTERCQKLFEKPLRGHLKKRSLTIFATGDAICAVTLTANSGFVRSALTQGVAFPVFIHESRALTEGKELWERSVKKEKLQNQE